MARVTQADVFAVLDDLDYPAAKEDIVRHAEAKGASDEVLKAVRGLALGNYASRDELARSLDTAESGAG